MEFDKETIRELLDYTWKLEKEMRQQLILNFVELSKHHSEIDKIRDKLIDIDLSINKDDSTVKGKQDG